ncbi:hypothetical protein [Streptomyces sp. NBC_01304]|uniref:hypothetical protein n=1 Tax=Streptomyces sp. NBC_01304 TaxID=2903818 RepID=UPI002E11AD9E|nr:hypothetical protein OG430_07285 [Streptomyces sp. NBC_01304]
MAALVASVASVWHGRNQLQISREANHLPVLAALLAQFRTVELNDHYIYVCTKLREEHSPELGISGLPQPAREAVYDVAYFLQTFAGMASLGIASERELLAVLHTRDEPPAPMEDEAPRPAAIREGPPAPGRTGTPRFSIAPVQR